MTNKEFIKYIKAVGDVNINDEEIKSHLEICENASIELVNFYKELKDLRIDSNICIEILSIGIKNNFSVKDFKMLVKHIRYNGKILGYFWLNPRKRMYEIMNTLLKRLDGIEDRHERIDIINSIKLSDAKAFYFNGNRYSILKRNSDNTVELKSDNGKLYSNIYCVGMKINKVNRVRTAMLTYIDYERTPFKEKEEYFKVYF